MITLHGDTLTFTFPEVARAVRSLIYRKIKQIAAELPPTWARAELISQIESHRDFPKLSVERQERAGERLCKWMPADVESALEEVTVNLGGLRSDSFTGLEIKFQRTMRIPADGKTYALPIGLGQLSLRSVADFPETAPASWLKDGGVILSLARSEAIWLWFATRYPVAIRIGTREIDLLSGAAWRPGLQREPQNYLVIPVWGESEVARRFIVLSFGDDPAHQAVEKIKAAKASYVLSREGWLCVSRLCLELREMLGEVGQYRLSCLCFFMYAWALWNEDQIGEGGVMSSVRSRSSPEITRDHVPEPEYTEDNAEARIQTALDKKSLDLDLSQLELKQVPESLRRIVWIESLNLCDNELTSLPEWIGALTNLQSLHISGNRITAFPKSFGNLTNLRVLSLCEAGLHILPEMPSTLSNLRELYVWGNLLTTLPESLGNLRSLEKISAFANQIESVPDSLGKLPNLKALYLDANRLSSLPHWLLGMAKRCTLGVSDDPLTQ